MTTTHTELSVFATDTAPRYHSSRACRALRNAQDLSDWDCWDDYCRHDHPMPRPVRELSLTDAAAAGKWPCHTCYPAGIQFPPIPPSNDSFGHEPQWIAGDHFCRRCKDRGQDDYGDQWSYPTLWPCTSAVVLGLAPRQLP